MTKKEYTHYLKSKHWASFKAWVYSLVHRCAACGSDDRLNIHHISYGRLGREKLEDVVVLCRQCHTYLHNSEKMGFSKERWIKLHCSKINEFRKKVKQDKKKRRFHDPLIDKAWHSALRHYAKQGNSKAFSETMKAAPKLQKQIKNKPNEI
jgi:phage terminase large subunit GpA-like protein